MAQRNAYSRWLDRVFFFFSRRLTKGQVERHIVAYRATGGRIGGRMGELPILLLTTTGRKSGQPRTVALNALPDGGTWVVIGSNSGRPDPPMWLGNIAAQPQVTVQVGRRVFPATATVASPAEHQRLWTRLIAKAPYYTRYTQIAGRPIALVILRPTK